LSVAEAATLVGVNEKTIRRMISDDVLPCARFGRVIRVRRADVDALFRRRRP
jgi:excisionase family DNA binding protein